MFVILVSLSVPLVYIPTHNVLCTYVARENPRVARERAKALLAFEHNLMGRILPLGFPGVGLTVSRYDAANQRRDIDRDGM